MASAPANNGKLRFRVRFGPYELDPNARVLRKGGTPVHLPEQPWQVLCALLERPGAVVTREELQERLWPGTFVDFEKSLNKVVNKLREALSDSADKPRFVETVVRQGYRFIAPVEIEFPSPSAAAVPDGISGSAVQPAAHPGFAAVEPKAGYHRRAIAGVAVAAMVLAGAGYWWLRPETYPVDLHPVPLLSWPGQARTPSFSPDGNKVAFSWNSEKQDRFHIYIQQIGSRTPPLQVTSGPADDACPAWSPDDRYIAFLRRAGTGRALLLVPSIGGTERKIMEFPAGAEGCLSWTPDSKCVAVSVRDSPRDPYGIWLVSPGSGERRRLTEPPAGTLGGDTGPSISRDGRSVVFIRDVRNAIQAAYVLPLSKDSQPDGEPREFIHEHYGSMGGIAWTADGRAMVYSGGPYATRSLFRVPASGRRSPSRLPYALQDAAEPTISTAHSRLVYLWNTSTRNLWRLDARTGERKILVASNRISETPQYSPDGRKLAFQSNRSGEMGIWTCDADGSNCVELTAFGNTTGGTPRWSPDSQWIAFDSRVAGQSQIYVIQADGGGQRRMTNDSADDITPSWSRDGRWIYFASDRSGRMETWKIPAAGGAPVEVTQAGGGPAFESVDGAFLYYFKYVVWGTDPAPLFRMPVEGGAEVSVLPRVANWGSFGVAAKAIYFTPDGNTIQRLELSTRKLSTLASMEKGFYGLSVSPDEAFVVWSQFDRESRELMLVEGFR